MVVLTSECPIAYLRILCFECMGHLNPTALGLTVMLPLRPRGKDLLAQVGRQTARQHHNAIFVPFGLSHHDDAAIKIHILDAQTHPFH